MVPPPRRIGSPGVSAFINVCAIFFLCANLIKDYALLHERAVNGFAAVVAPDNDRPRREDDARAVSPIGVAIPRGRAVALPSIRTSQEEEKKIARGQYGGHGDKPHLGGFTEFDVRKTIRKALLIRRMF